MAHVKFDCSRKDTRLIVKVAKRAIQEGLRNSTDLQDVQMDITATHCNGNPLRLEELLAAKPGDFGHDVMGIYRFLDRDTGKLTGHFLPRYSAPKPGDRPAKVTA